MALRRAITALAQGGPPPGANAHPLVSALNPSVTRGDLLLVGCTSGLDVDGGGAREVLGVTAMVAGLKMRPAQVRVGSHVELERVWKELVGAAEKVAAMELKLGVGDGGGQGRWGCGVVCCGVGVLFVCWWCGVVFVGLVWWCNAGRWGVGYGGVRWYCVAFRCVVACSSVLLCIPSSFAAL